LEYGFLLALILGTVVAVQRRLPRGVEHSPDDLAAVGGRQNPERAREPSDHGEPSPVKVKTWMRLTGQARAVISHAKAQGTKVPDDGQVNVRAGIDARAGHEFTDHEACKGGDPAQLPVQEGTRDEIPRGARRSRVWCESQPPNGQGGSR
jgi:hypothetical protein